MEPTFTLIAALLSSLRVALAGDARDRQRMPAYLQCVLLVLLTRLPAPLRRALARIPVLRRLVRLAEARARLAHLFWGDALALGLLRDWHVSGGRNRGPRAAAPPPPPHHPKHPARAPPLGA